MSLLYRYLRVCLFAAERVNPFTSLHALDVGISWYMYGLLLEATSLFGALVD